MDDQAKTTPENAPQSLPLLMDHPDLLRVRILPAEFARLLGVSKQTVSQWIKQGKLTINAVDGRLDVQTAIRQVLRNTDPGRLRARVLRQAVQDVQGLRDEISRAHGEIESLRAELAEARRTSEIFKRYADDGDCFERKFMGALIEREHDLRNTPDSEAWAGLLNQLWDMALDECDREAGEAVWLDAEIAEGEAILDRFEGG